MHSPSTRLWSRLYVTSSAGCALLTARATESDFQYDVKAKTAEIANAMINPFVPLPASEPTATPTTATNTTKPMSNSAVRRLFDAMRSFITNRSSRLAQRLQRVQLRRTRAMRNQTFAPR